MTTIYGGLGISPARQSRAIALKPCQKEYVPAGTWNIQCGLYTTIQELDNVSGIWRQIGAVGDNSYRYVNSDGANYRIANMSGGVAGAKVTNAGSGYTSAPTVTDNGGSATYVAIVGGAVNTSVTVTNGGTNYTVAPNVEFDNPPPGGVPATGYATISSGAVTSVTITNQGAGYASAPGINFVNDVNDTTGGGAAATAVLTGAGTVTAVLVTNPGTVVTSVPTLTFSGGGGSGAAATAVMCFTTTAYTVTSAGSGYLGNVLIIGEGVMSSSDASYTNPAIQSGLVRSRRATYAGAISSTGITTAGQTLYDGGIFPVVPTGYVVGGPASGSGFAQSAALVSFSCGGSNDVVLIQPV